MKNLILALTILVTSLSAGADVFGSDYSALFDLVKFGAKGLQSSVVLAQDGTNQLDDATVARLTEIARDQAGIWGDTILEGDYFADGATQLDEVVAYVRGGEIVAYRITYSERAWDTSDCGFDGQDLETLTMCQAGRISESTYVSGHFTSYTRDMEALAEFHD